VSSTKLIFILLNITLSNFSILKQHKIDAKGLKNAVHKQQEILENQMG
jgi:hypothetical protein